MRQRSELARTLAPSFLHRDEELLNRHGVLATLALHRGLKPSERQRDRHSASFRTQQRGVFCMILEMQFADAMLQERTCLLMQRRRHMPQQERSELAWTEEPSLVRQWIHLGRHSASSKDKPQLGKGPNIMHTLRRWRQVCKRVGQHRQMWHELNAASSHTTSPQTPSSYMHLSATTLSISMDSRSFIPASGS